MYGGQDDGGYDEPAPAAAPAAPAAPDYAEELQKLAELKAAAPIGCGAAACSQHGRARLRRRHRRAHQRRRRGLVCALCSASASATATATWRRTTWSDGARRLAPVVRLVRLQRRHRARRRRPRRHGLGRHPVAAAAAALAWMFAEWIARGKPSVLGIISGAVAGLVAITPASGFVGPTGALIIGLVAGVVCFWAVDPLKHTLGYDDSLDAFGVHGVGGFVGAMLTGVFADGDRRRRRPARRQSRPGLDAVHWHAGDDLLVGRRQLHHPQGRRRHRRPPGHQGRSRSRVSTSTSTAKSSNSRQRPDRLGRAFGPGPAMGRGHLFLDPALSRSRPPPASLFRRSPKPSRSVIFAGGPSRRNLNGGFTLGRYGQAVHRVRTDPMRSSRSVHVSVADGAFRRLIQRNLAAFAGLAALAARPLSPPAWSPGASTTLASATPPTAACAMSSASPGRSLPTSSASSLVSAHRCCWCGR